MTNEQIAELIGFKQDGNGSWFICTNHGDWYGENPPDFLHSLDACEKWIMPVVRKQGGYWNIWERKDYSEWVVMIDDDGGNSIIQITAEYLPSGICKAAYKYLSGVK